MLVEWLLSLHNFVQVATPVSRELLDELGPDGVKILLELMRDAYFDLQNEKKDFIAMGENEITEEWVVQVMQRWRKSMVPSSIIPIHEKQDRSSAGRRGRPPTIDFCFRDQWDKKSYFGAECKLVEANNKGLCDEYVDEGMKRYIIGKYNPKHQEGAMIGYVRQTSCSAVVDEICVRVSVFESGVELEKSQELLPFDEYYLSTHQKLKSATTFRIHHLLFSLSSSN